MEILNKFKEQTERESKLLDIVDKLEKEVKDLKSQISKRDKIYTEYQMIKTAINKYYKENSLNLNKTIPYKNTVF